MAVTRPDKFFSATYDRADGVWTTVIVRWREEISDGTTSWERERTETYLIEDLPAEVKADLLAAWNGLKEHRNSIHPLG